jgi:hypothetical protein
MRHTLSDLLLPVLNQASEESLEIRLALRVYLVKLQNAITKRVSVVVIDRSPNPIARRFQEIALRGDLEAIKRFLFVEKERNRPATSSLAKNALDWLGDDSPVQKCLEDAWKNAEAKYEPLPFPLGKNWLSDETLNLAARREFLTQAFGRLIQ